MLEIEKLGIKDYNFNMFNYSRPCHEILLAQIIILVLPTLISTVLCTYPYKLFTWKAN